MDLTMEKCWGFLTQNRALSWNSQGENVLIRSSTGQKEVRLTKLIADLIIQQQQHGKIEVST